MFLVGWRLVHLGLVVLQPGLGPRLAILQVFPVASGLVLVLVVLGLELRPAHGLW